MATLIRRILQPTPKATLLNLHRTLNPSHMVNTKPMKVQLTLHQRTNLRKHIHKLNRMPTMNLKHTNKTTHSRRTLNHKTTLHSKPYQKRHMVQQFDKL